MQSGLGSPPIAPGGFAGELPQNLISSPSGPTTMAWVYKPIHREPTYTLAVQDGWTDWHVQIDCHGTTAQAAQTLMYAIRDVLKGEYSGTLADSDATVVQGIFDLGTDLIMFNDSTHTYVRVLEYEVIFQMDSFA